MAPAGASSPLAAPSPSLPLASVPSASLKQASPHSAGIRSLSLSFSLSRGPLPLYRSFPFPEHTQPNPGLLPDSLPPQGLRSGPAEPIPLAFSTLAAPLSQRATPSLGHACAGRLQEVLSFLCHDPFYPDGVCVLPLDQTPQGHCLL